jgi:uncharacterized protein (TIGR02611 family)
MSGTPRSLSVKVRDMSPTELVTDSMTTDEPSPEQHHHSRFKFLDRLRSNPTSHLTLKIVIGILGAIVVIVGIVLIPLPGPGWAIVILGLAIWAVEFAWARHLLHFTRRHVQAWTNWVMKQPLGLRFVIGLAGMIFISAVVWASVKLTTGIDLATLIWNFLFQN